MDEVTIADLVAADRIAEIGCDVCELHMYADACLLAVSDDTPAPQICDHIGCPNPEFGLRNPKPGQDTRSGADRIQDLREWGLVRLLGVCDPAKHTQ